MPTYNINLSYTYLYKTKDYPGGIGPNLALNAYNLWSSSVAFVQSTFAGWTAIGFGENTYGHYSGYSNSTYNYDGETITLNQHWIPLKANITGSESITSASLGTVSFPSGGSLNSIEFYENSSSNLFLGGQYFYTDVNGISASPVAASNVFASLSFSANQTKYIDVTSLFQKNLKGITVSSSAIRTFETSRNTGFLITQHTMIINTRRVQHGIGVISAATTTPNAISAGYIPGESSTASNYFYYTNGSYPLVTYGGSVTATTGTSTASSITISSSAWSSSPQYNASAGNLLALIVSTMSPAGTASVGVGTPNGWALRYQTSISASNSTSAGYGYQVFTKPSVGTLSDSVTFIQSSSVNSSFVAHGVYLINAAGLSGGYGGPSGAPTGYSPTFPSINAKGYFISNEVTSFPFIGGVWSDYSLNKNTASVSSVGGIMSSIEIYGTDKNSGTNYPLSAGVNPVYTGLNGKIFSRVNAIQLFPYALNSLNKANFAVINNGSITYNNGGSGIPTTSSVINFVPYNLDKDSSSVGYSGLSTVSANFSGASSTITLPTSNIFYEQGFQPIPVFYYFATDTSFRIRMANVVNDVIKSTYDPITSASIIQKNTGSIVSSGTIGTSAGDFPVILNLSPNTEYDINLSASVSSACPTLIAKGVYKYITPSSSPVGTGNSFIIFSTVDAYGGPRWPNAIVSNNSNFTSASTYADTVGYYDLFSYNGTTNYAIPSPRPYSDQSSKFFSVHSSYTNAWSSIVNASVSVSLNRYEFINNHFINQTNWSTGNNILQGNNKVALVSYINNAYTNKGMGWVFTNSNNTNILAGAGNAIISSSNGGMNFTSSTFASGFYSTGASISGSIVLTGFKKDSNILTPNNFYPYATALATAVTNNFGQSWSENIFSPSVSGLTGLMAHSVSPIVLLNGKYFLYYTGTSSATGLRYIIAASATSITGPWSSKIAFNSSSTMLDLSLSINYFLEKGLNFNASAVCISKPYSSDSIDYPYSVPNAQHKDILWTSTDGWNFASASFPIKNINAEGPRWSPSSSLWFFADTSITDSATLGTETASVWYSSNVTLPLSSWNLATTYTMNTLGYAKPPNVIRMYLR